MSEESLSKAHHEPHETQLPTSTSLDDAATAKTNTQPTRDDAASTLVTTQEQQHNTINTPQQQQDDTVAPPQDQAAGQDEASSDKTPTQPSETTPRQTDAPHGVLGAPFSPSSVKTPTPNNDSSDSDSDEPLAQRVSRAKEKQRAVDTSSDEDASGGVGLGIDGDFPKASDMPSYEQYFPRGINNPAVFEEGANAVMQDSMPAPISGRQPVREVVEEPQEEREWVMTQADMLERIALQAHEYASIDHRAQQLRKTASNPSLFAEAQDDLEDLRGTYESLSTLNSSILQDRAKAIPPTSGEQQQQQQPQLQTQSRLQQQRQQEQQQQQQQLQQHAAESSNRKKRRDQEREAAKQAKQAEVNRRAAQAAQRRGKARKQHLRGASSRPVEEIDKALWQGIKSDMAKKVQERYDAGDERGGRTYHLLSVAAGLLAAEATKENLDVVENARNDLMGFANTQAEYGIFSLELDNLVREGAMATRLDPDNLTRQQHGKIRAECACLMLVEKCESPFPDTFIFHGQTGQVVAQPEDYLQRGASARDVERKRKAQRGEPVSSSSDDDDDEPSTKKPTSDPSSSQEVEQATQSAESAHEEQQDEPEEAEEQQHGELTEEQRDKRRKAAKRALWRAKQKRLAAERKEREKEAAREAKTASELKAARERDREAKARAQRMQASGVVAGQPEPDITKKAADDNKSEDAAAADLEAEHASTPSPPLPSASAMAPTTPPRAPPTEPDDERSDFPTSVKHVDPANVFLVSPKAGREGASSEPSTPLFSGRSSLDPDSPNITGMAAAYEDDFKHRRMSADQISAALQQRVAEREAERAARPPTSRQGSLRRVLSDSGTLGGLEVDVDSLTLNTPAEAAPAPTTDSHHDGAGSSRPPVLRGLQPSSPAGDPSPLVLPTEYSTAQQRQQGASGASMDDSPEAPSISMLGSPPNVHEGGEEKDDTEPEEQQEEWSGSSLQPQSTDTSSDGPGTGGGRRGRSAPPRLARTGSADYSERTLSESNADSDAYDDAAARYARSVADGSTTDEDDIPMETIQAGVDNQREHLADMFAGGHRDAEVPLPDLGYAVRVDIRGPSGEFAVLGVFGLEGGGRRGAHDDADSHAGDASRFADADDEDDGSLSDADDLWERQQAYGGGMPRDGSTYSVSHTTPGGSPESLRRSQNKQPERIYSQNYSNAMMMDVMGGGGGGQEVAMGARQDPYDVASAMQGHFGQGYQAPAPAPTYDQGAMGGRGGQERKGNLSAGLQSIKDRLSAKGITARGYAPPAVSDDPEQALMMLRGGGEEEPSSRWGGRWRDKPREKIHSNKPDADSIVREEHVGPDGKVQHTTRINEEAPLRKHSGAEHRYLPRPKMARNLQSRQVGVRLPERERTEDRLRLMLGGASASVGRERSLPWRTTPRQRVTAAPEVPEPSLDELELTLRQTVASGGAAGVEELD